MVFGIGQFNGVI